MIPGAEAPHIIPVDCQPGDAYNIPVIPGRDGAHRPEQPSAVDQYDEATGVAAERGIAVGDRVGHIAAVSVLEEEDSRPLQPLSEERRNAAPRAGRRVNLNWLRLKRNAKAPAGELTHFTPDDHEDFGQLEPLTFEEQAERHRRDTGLELLSPEEVGRHRDPASVVPGAADKLAASQALYTLPEIGGRPPTPYRAHFVDGVVSYIREEK